LTATCTLSLHDALPIFQEHVPTMARHTLNVSNMVLRSQTMRSLGLIPENGDAVLQGLVFDIIEQSRDTGQVLRKYVGCSYASGEDRKSTRLNSSHVKIS